MARVMVSSAPGDLEARGGCHCGAVRFEVKLQVEGPPELVDCNCSICGFPPQA
jgi:hypothetical protein